MNLPTVTQVIDDGQVSLKIVHYKTYAGLYAYLKRAIPRLTIMDNKSVNVLHYTTQNILDQHCELIGADKATLLAPGVLKYEMGGAVDKYQIKKEIA